MPRQPPETATASMASTASSSRPRESPSHQAPRLPRGTAAASTASSSPAGTHQVPRLPHKTAQRQRRPKPQRQWRPKPCLETQESHQVPPATQRSRGVIGVQSRPWRIQRVTKRRACHAKQPRSTSPKAVLGLCRQSPSAAPATQSSRGANGVQSRSVNGVQMPSRDYRESRRPKTSRDYHRVTKRRACHAKQPRRQRLITESHQVPPLPREAAAASTPSKAKQPRRQRRPKPSRVQRVTKGRACHAKQPRRQRRPKPSRDYRK